MSGGAAVVFQEGDRVKYEYDGVTDYGTVVKEDNSIYSISGDIWVRWDSNGWRQHATPRRLTLISREEQPKSMLKYPPHKYADVIKHWADGGEIQFKYQGPTDWETYAFPESFPHVGSPYFIWRIKPEVKTISYRVGITKDNQVKVYHKVPTLNDSYSSDAFKDWLDPEWRSVEVEV